MIESTAGTNRRPPRVLEAVPRALQPSPTTTRRIVRASARALPVVARSVAAGMTVLAAERAVLSIVHGARDRVRSPRGGPRVEETYRLRSEVTIVERVRYRR